MSTPTPSSPVEGPSLLPLSRPTPTQVLLVQSPAVDTDTDDLPPPAIETDDLPPPYVDTDAELPRRRSITSSSFATDADTVNWRSRGTMSKLEITRHHELEACA
ncbi:uncharacterized protein A4U43_C05F18950 [Asparagus officinalis]|uniref:Uncharacterized protein n=1 Tax=Asparagus officinalis TaxID=4686 RepID=A0A5P1ESP2_ASPOF|nr:uncharacterized protein A4U43_C05F18950 [Asparagus officinalis]